MRKNKLLTLSAVLLMTITAVGCAGKKETTVSSDSQVVSSSVKALTNEEVLEGAASTLWNMYKDLNGSYALGSYDVVKKVTLDGGTYSIDVSWEIKNVKGTVEGIALHEAYGTDKTNFQGIYVGYDDFVIVEESSFELVPTLTYNNVSKRMGELISKKSDGSEKCFTRKAKKFVFDTYASFVKTADKAKGSKDTSCTASILAYVSAISANGKYVFLRDQDHGYLVYGSGYNKQTDFKVGDPVIVSGCVYAYSGSYQFVSATIKVVTKTDPKLKEFYPTFEMPTEFIDVTSVFDGVKDNKDEQLAQYQEIKVEIKNCTLDSIDGNYYYFKTESGKKFNLYWSTSYFMDEATNNIWANAFYIGMKCTIRGYVNCYSSAHQIYPIDTNCIEYTDTDANCVAYASKNLALNGYKAFYGSAAEVTLPSPTVLGTSVTWSLKEAVEGYEIADGKLKITPVADAIRNATLVATISKGDVKVTKEYALASQILTDAQIAAKIKEGTTLAYDVTGGVTLPTTSDVYGGEITYAFKETAAAGYLISNGTIVVPQVAADSTATVTVVATIKSGTATETAEITLTPKHSTTIAEFLTAQDKTNKKLVRGVVVGAGADAKTNAEFMIYDGEHYLPVKTKLAVAPGQEVVLEGVFKDSYGLSTMDKAAIKIVLGTGRELPNNPSKTVTAAELETLATKIEDKDAATAKNNEILAEYQDKLVTITEGYVVNKSGTSFYGLATKADATTYSINLYFDGDYSKYVGKKVIITAVNKGSNVAYNNVSFQIISIKLA